MGIVLLLIPLAAMLVGLATWAFLWAINSGQYDDLDGAERVALEPDAELDEAPRPLP